MTLILNNEEIERVAGLIRQEKVTAAPGKKFVGLVQQRQGV